MAWAGSVAALASRTHASSHAPHFIQKRIAADDTAAAIVCPQYLAAASRSELEPERHLNRARIAPRVHLTKRGIALGINTQARPQPDKPALAPCPVAVTPDKPQISG